MRMENYTGLKIVNPKELTEQQLRECIVFQHNALNKIMNNILFHHVEEGLISGETVFELQRLIENNTSHVIENGKFTDEE